MRENFEFKLSYDAGQYKFNVLHKMTKIIGNSTTGKSELVTAVEMSHREIYGINIVYPYKTRVLGEQELMLLLQRIKEVRARYGEHLSEECIHAIRVYASEYDNYLIFCDEGTYGLESHEFALFYQFVDAFFVICARAPLSAIPYGYKRRLYYAMQWQISLVRTGVPRI